MRASLFPHVRFGCRLVFATIAWAAVKAHALDTPSFKQTVDHTIHALIAEHEIPGMAVGLTVDDQSFIFCYGETAKGSQAPVNEHTLFEIGSISKTFTATLAAHAEVSGALSLNDHPSRFMPELSGAPIDRATLAQLGTYSAAGFPLQFPNEVEKSDDATSYFKNWQPSVLPGEVRQYSNPSIGLLGHLTALALKRSFADAIEQRMLPKLGLTETFVRVPASHLSSYAWGTAGGDNRVRVSPGVFASEAYGIKTSATDFVRYLQLQIDPSRLSADWEKAITRTHEGAYAVGEMVQCLGWEMYAPPLSEEKLLSGNSGATIFEANKTTALSVPDFAPTSALYNKTGSTRGFGAYALFIPDRKIGLVLLANKSYPIASRIKAAWVILQSVDSIPR